MPLYTYVIVYKGESQNRQTAWKRQETIEGEELVVIAI
jgi:hypothetical protein